MVGQELPVYQEVVHGTAVRVAHHAVEHLAGLIAADVVGKDVVDKFLCLRAFHKNLAHVGHVEHAHMLPHRIVFYGDGTVLDGHDVACKGTHLGTQCHVGVVQTGFEFFHTYKCLIT